MQGGDSVQSSNIDQTSSTTNLDALLGVGTSSIDAEEASISSNISSSGAQTTGGMTMAEKLAAEYAATEGAGKQLTAVQERQEKRKAVLEQTKQVGWFGGFSWRALCYLYSRVGAPCH